MAVITDQPVSFARRARKTLAGLVVPALSVIAIVVPNYSDEAKAVVGLLGAALTGVAVYKVDNTYTPEDIKQQYYTG